MEAVPPTFQTNPENGQNLRHTVLVVQVVGGREAGAKRGLLEMVA